MSFNQFYDELPDDIKDVLEEIGLAEKNSYDRTFEMA